MKFKTRSYAEYILLLAVVAMIYAKFTTDLSMPEAFEPTRPDYRYIGDFPPYYGGEPPEHPFY